MDPLDSPDQYDMPTAAQDLESRRDDLMTRYGIRFDGRQYRFDGFRYDRLDDAIAYAALHRARYSVAADADGGDGSVRYAPPDAAQRALMAALSIAWIDGRYSLGPFRYELLADAVAQARSHPVT